MTLCIDTEGHAAVADTKGNPAAATARAEKLPQAILSKAFKGELVPTEAELARAEERSFETAEEMLRRVAGSRANDANHAPPRPGKRGRRAAGETGG